MSRQVRHAEDSAVREAADFQVPVLEKRVGRPRAALGDRDRAGVEAPDVVDALDGRDVRVARGDDGAGGERRELLVRPPEVAVGEEEPDVPRTATMRSAIALNASAEAFVS